MSVPVLINVCKQLNIPTHDVFGPSKSATIYWIMFPSSGSIQANFSLSAILVSKILLASLFPILRDQRGSMFFVCAKAASLNMLELSTYHILLYCLRFVVIGLLSCILVLCSNSNQSIISGLHNPFYADKNAPKLIYRKVDSTKYSVVIPWTPTAGGTTPSNHPSTVTIQPNRTDRRSSVRPVSPIVRHHSTPLTDEKLCRETI